MCGIHLVLQQQQRQRLLGDGSWLQAPHIHQDGSFSSFENSFTSSQNNHTNNHNYNTSWFLSRRGPDHHGCQRLVVVDRMKPNKDTTTTTKPTTTTTMELLLTCTVLHMQGTAIQPVPIAISRRMSTTSSCSNSSGCSDTRTNHHQDGTTNQPPDSDDDDDKQQSTPQDDNGRPTTPQPSSYGYLGWNGEVYEENDLDRGRRTITCCTTSRSQTTTRATTEPDRNQDVVSDTHLVAHWLEQELRTRTKAPPVPKSTCSHITTPMEPTTTTGHDVCQHDPTVSTNLLDAITSVLSSMVHTEFAFVWVLPSPFSLVLYGRDAWGRRSLLEQRSKYGKRLLQLSSVATSTTSTTRSPDANSNNSNDDEWREVPPGRVFQYHVPTGERTSRPLLRVAEKKWTLPQRSLTTTTTTSTATTIPYHASSLSSFSVTKPTYCTTAMWQASLQLEDFLLAAVRRRVMACRPGQRHHVAVLFSGGLDSVVLAAMAGQVVSVATVDLLNVAFFEKNDASSGGGSTSSSTASTAAPTIPADRLAAIQSYRELQRAVPACVFRLVCVNVTWEQVQAHESHIRQLIFPKTTVMDLNIGTALWFASRGEGFVYPTMDSTTEHVDIGDKGSSMETAACTHACTATTTPTTHHPYKSTCRILLVGMGADEQMAGYGRHRKAFEKGGDEQLRQELDLDMGRLWERNLGRDDRLLSDHGKEARFPFLDAHVVEFLRKLPLDCVCDLTKPAGVGDKQILRLVAQRLGLKTAGGLVKRAIQFGSRIAHVSDKQRFGSRRKAQGTSKC